MISCLGGHFMDEIIANKYFSLKDELNERPQRLWAASLGYGGVTNVAKTTGLSRTTITQGIAELRQKQHLAPHRVRREGGGRKKATVKQPKES
jgi:hypothetical protein